MISKQDAIAACQANIEAKRSALTKELEGLRSAQQNDTKSSAGDKHETSREMIAQEIGKLNASLAELNVHEASLNRIDASKMQPTVGLGALVETETSCFFIAAPLGSVTTEETTIMAISTAAPLAQLFIGKAAGARVSFNGIKHHLLNIY